MNVCARALTQSGSFIKLAIHTANQSKQVEPMHIFKCANYPSGRKKTTVIRNCVVLCVETFNCFFTVIHPYPFSSIQFIVSSNYFVEECCTKLLIRKFHFFIAGQEKNLEIGNKAMNRARDKEVHLIKQHHISDSQVHTLAIHAHRNLQSNPF